MEQQIRILLVDDHSLFRESLGRLLEAEPDFRVIGSYPSASDALAASEVGSADVVLLDYDLGEEQGGIFLETVRDRGLKGRIIIVTAGLSQNDTLRAFQ